MNGRICSSSRIRRSSQNSKGENGDRRKLVLKSIHCCVLRRSKNVKVIYICSLYVVFFDRLEMSFYYRRLIIETLTHSLTHTYVTFMVILPVSIRHTRRPSLYELLCHQGGNSSPVRVFETLPFTINASKRSYLSSPSTTTKRGTIS